METPEKIYILPSCHKSWYEEIRDDDNIEYIRTDAFIEKAVKWLDDHIINYMEFDEYSEMLCGFDKDRMIKEFRKYMKGE